MLTNEKRVRLGCYSANVTMSIVGNLSPILFLTFRELYGFSFSLLGLLVVINFATQLAVDVFFSFFSHKFNIPQSMKISATLAVLGLLLYALAPFLFPNVVYLGVALGTVVFSAASGLNEVLLSPIIAALPSDDPDRQMSRLHSIYAWGVVVLVVVSTLFLKLFGQARWFVLPLLYSAVPIFSAVMFFTATLPPLSTPEKTSGSLALFKNKQLWTCMLAIFLGGACELLMSQWCSSYLEQSLGIEKVWGDIFGTATFAIALGLGRTLYGKHGRNMEKTLLFSAIGTFFCYLVCILSPSPILGLIACAATGFCVSMMWPGSLVLAANRMATGGVVVYAVMAAGGDLGAAVAPQFMGVITDAVSASASAATWAARLGLTVDELSMKVGMGLGLVFALLACVVFFLIWRSKRKGERK